MNCDSLTCVIGAIPKDERTRYETLKSEIIAGIDRSKIVEHENGFTYFFSNEPKFLRKLGDWMAYEQACCPFFRFDLAVAPNGGLTSLKISGQSGVKVFLVALLEGSYPISENIPQPSSASAGIRSKLAVLLGGAGAVCALGCFFPIFGVLGLAAVEAYLCENKTVQILGGGLTVAAVIYIAFCAWQKRSTD